MPQDNLETDTDTLDRVFDQVRHHTAGGGTAVLGLAFCQMVHAIGISLDFDIDKTREVALKTVNGYFDREKEKEQ